MRQLTPEQQAAVPVGQAIGTLAEQGLPYEHNGLNFNRLGIQDFIDPATITDWRQAVALRCVRRSRYGQWEPFRKTDGGERSYRCEFGTAWATDGVHILIRQVNGTWFERSAQVIKLRSIATTPGLPIKDGVQLDTAEFIAELNKPRSSKVRVSKEPELSCADEYVNL